MIDRIARIALLLLLAFFIGIIVYFSFAEASDYHQSGQSHKVVYVITDSSGNPVTGETPKLAVSRTTDNAFLDFSDNTFKASGWTTRLQTLSYDPIGEYYFRVITLDNATIRVSTDVVCIISNDSALYGDQQVEVVHYDSLANLVRSNR